MGDVGHRSLSASPLHSSVIGIQYIDDLGHAHDLCAVHRNSFRYTLLDGLDSVVCSRNLDHDVVSCLPVVVGKSHDCIVAFIKWCSLDGNISILTVGLIIDFAEDCGNLGDHLSLECHGSHVVIAFLLQHLSENFHGSSALCRMDQHLISIAWILCASYGTVLDCKMCLFLCYVVDPELCPGLSLYSLEIVAHNISSALIKLQTFAVDFIWNNCTFTDFNLIFRENLSLSDILLGHSSVKYIERKGLFAYLIPFHKSWAYSLDFMVMAAYSKAISLSEVPFSFSHHNGVLSAVRVSSHPQEVLKDNGRWSLHSKDVVWMVETHIVSVSGHHMALLLQ